jgi:hypothetical protein
VFSFTWDVIFKLFFSLLPFSIWFERYRRRLDDMYARLETYQNHIRVILNTLHVLPVIYKLHSVLAVEFSWACCCTGYSIWFPDRRQSNPGESGHFGTKWCAGHPRGEHQGRAEGANNWFR